MALFNKSAAITDPLLPDEDARYLRDSRDLLPFRERCLPAEPSPIRWLLIPVAGLQLAGAGIAALAAYRLGAYDIPALHLQQIPYALVIAALIAGCIALWTGIDGVRNWRTIAAERRSLIRAIHYHRRYVVPDTDLDDDAMRVWERAGRAARTISRSDATPASGIDPVWVTAVLPHHQWDIAQKLARLSELRRRQREILSVAPGGMDGTDADIVRILTAQRAAQDVALADIEHHVRLLENLAGRVAALDARLKRKRAARDLAALNEQHAELVTMTGHDGAWYTADLEQAFRDLECD